MSEYFMFQSHKKKHYNVLIIGGGIYGCIIALTLKKYFKSICIVEEASSLMTRATYVNQARIHNGYHYPRHFLTSLRSHQNYSRFIREYSTCINNSFESIYAVARHNSKINSQQFITRCNLLGIPLRPATKATRSLFNSHMIEDVFITEEAVFDAIKMKSLIERQIQNEHIETIFDTSVTSVSRSSYIIHIATSKKKTFSATYVFNCSYSRINFILQKSQLSFLPFKHELTEMLIIKMPEELKHTGITLMDGPFFLSFLSQARAYIL